MQVRVLPAYERPQLRWNSNPHDMDGGAGSVVHACMCTCLHMCDACLFGWRACIATATGDGSFHPRQERHAVKLLRVHLRCADNINYGWLAL